MNDELKKEMEPCAAWANDCNGKKDYDGRLLSISCRYWPGPEGGSTMTVENGPGGVKIGSVPYGPKPSANASIRLNLGVPDEYDGYADYVVWREKKFESETEEEVKSLVEAWVKEQVAAVVELLEIDLSKRR